MRFIIILLIFLVIPSGLGYAGSMGLDLRLEVNQVSDAAPTPAEPLKFGSAPLTFGVTPLTFGS